MIIAYGFFIISLIFVTPILFIFIAFVFTSKINHKEEQVNKLTMPFWFWLIVCLISAQYIWG